MLIALGRGLTPQPAGATLPAIYLVDEDGNALLAADGQFLSAE